MCSRIGVTVFEICADAPAGPESASNALTRTLEVPFFFPCAVENCMSGEVALDHQRARYRPRSGAILQLCFGRTRGLCIESEYPLSNRAEKRVEAPGPCCTLEFAVLSRPDGQQPKKTYAASPCRMDRLSPRPGGLQLVAARQIVQQVQRSCAHA